MAVMASHATSASPADAPRESGHAAATPPTDSPPRKADVAGADSDGDDDDALEDVFDDESGAEDQTGAAASQPLPPRLSVDDRIAALARHASKIRMDAADDDDSEDWAGNSNGGGGGGGAARSKDKSDRATSEQVLDRRTRMVLLQLINRGVVSEVHGAVSTGKEANVYGAVSEAPGGLMVYRAIKVYKTAILAFRDRERYITGEHRFRAGYEKGNSRKMVRLWAEKEFRNLRRIHAAGIPCPEPLHLKLHVLVMGFLGDGRGWAYPRLRDAIIVGDEEADQRWHALYVQLLALMRRMYQVCRLVHADLSEYNVLYHRDTLYIIDVSQSVEPDHPRALEFLRMDIKNVADFFRRRGVDTLPDRAVFNFVLAPEGPVEGEPLKAAIEKLYEARPAAVDGEDDAGAAAAEQEVDNEVFRNQFIPRTLDEVYDFEKDGRRIGEGEGRELTYRSLLADAVVDGKKKQRHAPHGEAGSESESEESNNGVLLSGSESDEVSEEGGDGRHDKGRPRGKKHEDKDEKKAHKQAVKEAKREKRKEKMPKHIKKRLVTTTAKKVR